MKKAKNITLLIGCIFHLVNFLGVMIHAAMLYYGSLEFRREGVLTVLFVNQVFPTTLIFALQSFSVALLVRNLKNKTGKALPIVCIVINGVILLLSLGVMLLGSLPSQLLYYKMGLFGLEQVLRLVAGIVLQIVIYGLLITGSCLSLPKKSHQCIHMK